MLIYQASEYTLILVIVKFIFRLFVAPTIVWTIFHFGFAIILISRRFWSSNYMLHNNQQSSKSEVLSKMESLVFSFTHLLFIYLYIFFQEFVKPFHFHWFSAIIALSHIPTSFLLPLLYFACTDSRWIYFKKFMTELYDS